MSITIDNIKFSKKKITEEMKKKTINKKEGHDLLDNLENMENHIKINKGRGGHMGGRMNGGAMNNAEIIKNVQKFITMNVDNGYISNMLLTFIHVVANKVTKSEINLELLKKIYGDIAREKDDEVLEYCPYLLYQKIPLKHIPDSDILSRVFNSSGDDSMKRLAMIICNKTRAKHLNTIMQNIFENMEAKNILAYLINHYTPITVVFGLGVIAYTNPYQVFTKIRDIVAYNFNKTKHLLLKQNTIVDPIIMIPPDITDKDVDIETEIEPEK